MRVGYAGRPGMIPARFPSRFGPLRADHRVCTYTRVHAPGKLSPRNCERLQSKLPRPVSRSFCSLCLFSLVPVCGVEPTRVSSRARCISQHVTRRNRRSIACYMQLIFSMRPLSQLRFIFNETTAITKILKNIVFINTFVLCSVLIKKINFDLNYKIMQSLLLKHEKNCNILIYYMHLIFLSESIIF